MQATVLAAALLVPLAQAQEVILDDDSTIFITVDA